jgi:hypothetical protein
MRQVLFDPAAIQRGAAGIQHMEVSILKRAQSR